MFNVLKKIYSMFKNYKTTIFGFIAAFLYSYNSGAAECVANNQVDFHCTMHLLFSAAIFAAMAAAKDFNVTGGAKMVAAFILLSVSVNAQSVTEDNQRYHNSYLPAAEPKGAILVNYEGSIGTDTTKMLSDTLIRIVSDETPNAQTTPSLAQTNTTAGIYIAQGDSINYGGLRYVKATGSVSLFGSLDGGEYALEITPTGATFIDSNGSRVINSFYTGSYTPDTSNAIKYVCSSKSTANYTVNDSIIEIYGYVSGVSSDSLTQCELMLSLPIGFTSTVNTLNGICSVYSPAQRVEGNGVVTASGTKAYLAFYSSRKARADIYYRFSYRYK